MCVFMTLLPNRLLKNMHHIPMYVIYNMLALTGGPSPTVDRCWKPVSRTAACDSM